MDFRILLAVLVFVPLSACSESTPTGSSDAGSPFLEPPEGTPDGIVAGDEEEEEDAEELPPSNAIDETCHTDATIAQEEVPMAYGDSELLWNGFSSLGIRGNGWNDRWVYYWSNRTQTHAARGCMRMCEERAEACVACACNSRKDRRGRYRCYLKAPFVCDQLVPSRRTTYVKSTFVDSACGNGTLDEGEECDDGNQETGDGCDDSCILENGFHCPTVGESCSDACLQSSAALTMPATHPNRWTRAFEGPSWEGDPPLKEAIIYTTPDVALLEAVELKVYGSECAMNLAVVTLDANGDPEGEVLATLDIEVGDLTSRDEGQDWTRLTFDTPLYLDRNQSIAVVGERTVPRNIFVNSIHNDRSSLRCSAEQAPSVRNHRVMRHSEGSWATATYSPKNLRWIGQRLSCRGEAQCTAPEHSAVCTCAEGWVYDYDLDRCGTVCGDGTVAGDEACDDGNMVDGDGCDMGCIPSACGNGIQAPNEGCDDGNLEDGDGCDSDCTVPICGDGHRSPTEVCDDGNDVNGDTCDEGCILPGCGNGVTGGSEACDDGNEINGDGCDNDCTVSACGNGIPTPSTGEECDDDNEIEGDGCDSNCTVSMCGNGIKDPSEACDDGNLADGHPAAAEGEECEENCEVDTCDSNCTVSACGNGIVTYPEMCDDGNDVDTDGCANDCTHSVCGDGAVTHQEACDDGNLAGGDGCSGRCTVGTGWYCPSAGEACVANASCHPDTMRLAESSLPASGAVFKAAAQEDSVAVSVSLPHGSVELRSVQVLVGNHSDCWRMSIEVRRASSGRDAYDDFPNGTVIGSISKILNSDQQWVTIPISSGASARFLDNQMFGIKFTPVGTCKIWRADPTSSAGFDQRLQWDTSYAQPDLYRGVNPDLRLPWGQGGADHGVVMRVDGIPYACDQTSQTCYAVDETEFECR